MSMLLQIEETLIKLLYYTNKIYSKSTWLEKHDIKVHIVDTGVITIDLHSEGLNNKQSFDFWYQFTMTQLTSPWHKKLKRNKRTFI